MGRVGIIEVFTAPERTHVHLVGDVTSDLRWEASLALSETLQAGCPVTVHAERATDIDVSGMAFLIQCINGCEQAGLRITITGAHGYIAELIDTFGLAHVLREQ